MTLELADFAQIEAKIRSTERAILSNVNKIIERIERVLSFDHQIAKLNAKRDQLLNKLDKQLEQNLRNARTFTPSLDFYHFKTSDSLTSYSKLEFIYLKASIAYPNDPIDLHKKLAYSHLYNSLRLVSLHYDFDFTEKHNNYLLDNDKCLVLDTAARELKLLNRRTKFCLKRLSIKRDVYSSQAILFKSGRIGLLMRRETPDQAVHIYFYLFDRELNFIRKGNFTSLVPALFKYDLAYKHTESDDLVLEFNYIDYFRTKSGLECQAANKYYIVNLDDLSVKHAFTMKVERHVNKRLNSLLSSDRRLRSVEGNTVDVLANDNSLVTKIYINNQIMQMFLDSRSNIYLISKQGADCCFTITCFDVNGTLLFEKKLKNICDSFEMYDEKLVFIKNRKPIAVL
jgi:hypothetical protein